jgi:hypothetical protein
LAMTAHSGLNWCVPTAILSPTIKQSGIISVLLIQNTRILLGVPKSVILLLDCQDWHIHPSPHLLPANDHIRQNNPDKIDQDQPNALLDRHSRYNHWVDVSARSITDLSRFNCPNSSDCQDRNCWPTADCVLDDPDSVPELFAIVLHRSTHSIWAVDLVGVRLPPLYETLASCFLLLFFHAGNPAFLIKIHKIVVAHSVARAIRA